jgi:acetyl esterase/lipase
MVLVSAAAGVAWGAARPAPTYGDVSYGPHPHQRMDIYVPQGESPYPVVMWFGGLWKPSRFPKEVEFFLKMKCAMVAVQTRTLTDAVDDRMRVPIAYVARDACRVVQFVRFNAARWNLDPRRIAVGGSSQGALPALYVACAGEQADPHATDPVARVSTRVVCAAAYRSQPSIDPRRMQEWVPGVEWGAPALGCTFKESLERREELQPIISRYSPDALLRRGTPPLYFENDTGLTRPEGINEMPYKVHSPAWALGFQKLAREAGVECHVNYPGHPTDHYRDIWDFVVQQLQAPPRGRRINRNRVRIRNAERNLTRLVVTWRAMSETPLIPAPASSTSASPTRWRWWPEAARRRSRCIPDRF